MGPQGLHDTFLDPLTHFVFEIEGLKRLLDGAVGQDDGRRLKGSLQPTIQADFLEPV